MRLRHIRRAKEDGRFVNRPYECQALYGAWQYGRLFRQCLNCNYFWFGQVMCRRGGSPIYRGHRPNRALSAYRFCRLPEPHRRRAPGSRARRPWLFLPGVLCNQRIPPPEAGPPHIDRVRLIPLRYKRLKRFLRQTTDLRTSLTGRKAACSIGAGGLCMCRLSWRRCRDCCRRPRACSCATRRPRSPCRGWPAWRGRR